jgi:hypothetical protein
MNVTAEQMQTVVEIAALAPSVHNTQPWRFVVTGHTVQVRADQERQLSALDPTARQLHISCGIAVEYARLAIRYLGYDCVVRVAPGGPDDPALLASLTVGTPAAPSALERRLVEAIPRRYTDRGPYAGIPLPPGVVDRLRVAAASRGCWLRALDRRGERTVVTTLLAEAEAMQARDSGIRDELVAWTRAAPAADGVPLDATAWDRDDVVTDVPLRDFTGHDLHRHPGVDEPPRVEHDTLLRRCRSHLECLRDVSKKRRRRRSVLVPTTEWRARRDDLARLGSDMRRTLAGWNVSSSFVDVWLTSTVDSLPGDAEVTLCLDYDADVQLLSFDAMVDGRRVYGADDFVM